MTVPRRALLVAVAMVRMVVGAVVVVAAGPAPGMATGAVAGQQARLTRIPKGGQLMDQSIVTVLRERQPRHPTMLKLGLTAISALAIAVAGGQPAVAAGKPGPPPNSGVYVRAYANILNGVQYGLTPQDVQATSDGGSITLASTGTAGGVLVNWLLKVDSSGTAQWQRELGCFGLAPGSYSVGATLAQTIDGGYVVAGGTTGCGVQASCPDGGIECGLVEKIDASGNVSWAKAYRTGAYATNISKIRQAADGGYIAAGSTQDTSDAIGGLILKLDSVGNVQWQRKIGPNGSAKAILNTIVPTVDGGYFASGQTYGAIAGVARQSALAVKLDGSGTVAWQHAFNNLDSSGTPRGSLIVPAAVQSADGGYLLAGGWTSDPSLPGGQATAGALLLKLDASGAVLWQKAHSGGTYCFFNGFNQTCTSIGAFVYSIRINTDGSYQLAGDGDLKLNDSVPLVPWLARSDVDGNLTWQHFYYQANASTGRPISQYFASAATTANGGSLAVGFTEDSVNGKGLLYAVKTDSSGLIGTCGQVHAATPLNVVDPGLVALSPALPVQTTITAPVASPATTTVTSVRTQTDC
jgi:hypothetical protein